MDENIVIKGTPQKNRPALIVIVAGAALVLLSFIIASYVFNNNEGYESFGFGYGGWYYWCVIYDSFGEFFTAEFFNLSCYFGYILLIGIIALIVGIIIKVNTENCEITVTNSRIYGKLPRGKDVDIPLNQITALNSGSFNGISVSSIGSVSNFHCIENCKEVMKAISYLLSNPTTATNSTTVDRGTMSSDSEVETLKRFKELLDSGVISNEEFEEKKKQILGL